MSTVYVDIPTLDCVTNDDGAFQPVTTFETRAEAIKFCQEHFGADEQGRVALVTGGDPVNTVHLEHYGVSDSEQANEPAEIDPDDLCPVTQQRHQPDWKSTSVEHDGGETYIDVSCTDCGRSGCVGTTKTLAGGICW